MNVIEPSFEIVDPKVDDRDMILEKIESIGRTCYQSGDRITEDSASAFVKNLVRRGHLSVIEHITATVRFVHNRGFTHELVRHRLASYSQESTRYVSNKGSINFIKPYWVKDTQEGDIMYSLWYSQMIDIEDTYHTMLNSGLSPQAARGVLPNDIKTEIVITANLREWLHIFNMRDVSAAHPDMRRVMTPLRKQFIEFLPEIFGEIR